MRQPYKLSIACNTTDKQFEIAITNGQRYTATFYSFDEWDKTFGYDAGGAIHGIEGLVNGILLAIHKEYTNE